MKRISVLTPAYNAGKFIRRAILNVQNQGYENFEHIVVDGGSTDNTVSVLQSFPHVKWISENDRGQSDAMNKAFNMCSGDMVVYLNADDYFEEDVFNTVMAEFAADDRADIVVGNGIKVNEEGRTEKWYSEFSYARCIQFYKYGFPLNSVSYFYKRKVQEHIAYNIRNHYAMDYEFLLRAFQLFKVKKLEKNFGYFYHDGTNKTSDINRAYQALKKTAIAHSLKYDPLKVFVILSDLTRRKILNIT